MKTMFALLFALSLAIVQPAHSAINVQGCSGVLTRTVTLPAGTKTAAINLGCFTLVGIQFAAFTGTAVTFEASSATDGTFVPVKATTSGTNLSYTVAQNTFASLDPKDFQGLSIIKIVSGSSEGSDRTLILYLKGM